MMESDQSLNLIGLDLAGGDGETWHWPGWD